jgi:undecaprenyl-diphosphatase
LPISSSGHLVILQKFFGFSKAPVSFDILLHLGTLIAVVFFFKKDLLDLIINWQKKTKLLFLILVGSLPAGFVGIFFKKQLENSFNSPLIVGIGYLVTAIFLFSTHFIRLKRLGSLNQIKISDAFLIGIFQALAILPGISRSGSTIVAGRWRGLSESASFSFSFLLAIPAIIGAVILELPDIFANGNHLGYSLLGMLISAVIGLFSLKFLQNVLKNRKFFLFGFYCFSLGILILLNYQK